MADPAQAFVYSLNGEHPTASHFICLASADRDGTSPFLVPTTGAAWSLADRAGTLIRAGDYVEIGKHHQSAALPMLLAALGHVPDGAIVRIVTVMENVVGLLNYGPEERRRRRYRSANKKVWSSRDLWEQLDAVLTERHIEVTAGRPKADCARHILVRTARGSADLARNYGKPFSEWEGR